MVRSMVKGNKAQELRVLHPDQKATQRGGWGRGREKEIDWAWDWD